jgi:hypothetical protein
MPANLRSVRAYSQPHLDLVGDDVVLFPAWIYPHGDHRGLACADFTRYDGPYRDHNTGSDHSLLAATNRREKR